MEERRDGVERGGRAAIRRGWAALLIAATMEARAAEMQPPRFIDPEIDVTNVSLGEAFNPRPDWTSYALTDALYWGRDNQATNRPLVTLVDGPVAPALMAHDLQFPMSAGVRAFYGQRAPDQGGWELGYFGVFGQSATQTVGATAQDFLQFPGDLGPIMTSEGELATVKYSSIINSAEFNLFSTSTEWRDPSASWLTVDWLVGFRYVGVEEQSSIAIDCCADGGDAIPIGYGVATRNNLFGAQIGNRSRWTWANWAFEGWAKAGVFGNAQEQIQQPLVDYLGEPVRPGLSRSGGVVSFVGDINTSIVYRLTDVWGIRAGYNLIWIDGLALAPNQYDFTNVPGTSGTNLVSGGGIFMHGANLGLEARW